MTTPTACALRLGTTLERINTSIATSNALDLGWRPLAGAEQAGLMAGLASRYPKRTALPIARRDDSDDICVVVFDEVGRQDGTILVVHDFADPGWEALGEEYDDIESWLVAEAAED